MKLRWAVGSVFLSMLAGIFIGWHQGSAAADEELYRLEVVHQLEVAGLCVGGLLDLNAGDSDRVRRLLHHRLESSIDQLYRFPASLDFHGRESA